MRLIINGLIHATFEKVPVTLNIDLYKDNFHINHQGEVTFIDVNGDITLLDRSSITLMTSN